MTRSRSDVFWHLVARLLNALSRLQRRARAARARALGVDPDAHARLHARVAKLRRGNDA